MLEKSNEALQQIRNELNQIIKNNEKSKSKWEKAQSEEEKKLNRISLDLSAVIEADEPARFMELLDEKNAAETRIQTMRRTMAQNEARPMIPEQDYKALAARIQDAADAAEHEALSYMLENYRQNMDAAERLQELQTTANEVITLLQHDIYRDADVIKTNNNGKQYYDQTAKRSAKLGEAIRFGNIDQLTQIKAIGNRITDSTYRRMAEKVKQYEEAQQG